MGCAHLSHWHFQILKVDFFFSTTLDCTEWSGHRSVYSSPSANSFRHISTLIGCFKCQKIHHINLSSSSFIVIVEKEKLIHQKIKQEHALFSFLLAANAKAAFWMGSADSIFNLNFHNSKPQGRGSEGVSEQNLNAALTGHLSTASFLMQRNSTKSPFTLKIYISTSAQCSFTDFFF